MCRLLLPLICLLSVASCYGQKVLVNGNSNWNATSSPFPPDPSTCLITTVGNIYIQTQNPNNGPVRVLYCMQAGGSLFQWQPIGYATVASLPAKCATGQMAFLTSAAVGQNWYGCTATNTWTLQSGGGTATGMSPTDTWAAIEAGTSGTGSVTPFMTWAQIEAL